MELIKRHARSMNLSELQHDVLCELINIGMGRAAGAMNKMTRNHIDISTPKVSLLSHKELASYYARAGDKLDIIKLTFEGHFSGATGLIFTQQNATNFVSLLLKDIDIHSRVFAALREDSLKEVGNIALIWIMGALSNALKEHLKYQPLEYLTEFESFLGSTREDILALLIKTIFEVENQRTSGEIVILFNQEKFASLIDSINALIDGGGSGCC